MKRKIIIILISFVAIIGMVSAILPFFNTGLVIATSSDVDIITLDEIAVSEATFIKLKPGKYKVIAGKIGYKKIEKEVRVKRYGKTKIELSLKTKIKPLLNNLPYYDPISNNFFIEGSYNKFKEPEYSISIFNKDKVTPEQWLESQGVNIKEVNIEYIQRGEPEEND